MPHATNASHKFLSHSNTRRNGGQRTPGAAHTVFGDRRRAPGIPRRLPLAVALGLVASHAGAGLIPTEVYYNGPLPGSDPDEFIELTNVGQDAISLAGFRFDEGLGLDFPDVALAPGESLVVAPRPAGFAQAFPDFPGAVLDARGGLSNGGETLSMLDGNGSLVFSFSYDDGATWPASADGSGDSLQLVPAFTDLSDPLSWEGGSPTPGAWSGTTVVEEQPAAISTPGTLSLLLGCSAMLWVARRRQASSMTDHASTVAQDVRWRLQAPAC